MAFVLVAVGIAIGALTRFRRWGLGLIATGLVIGIAGFAAGVWMEQPWTCDALADEVIATFSDEDVSPVRILDEEELLRAGRDLTCRGTAWWSRGSEGPLIFRVEETEDGPFISYELP